MYMHTCTYICIYIFLIHRIKLLPNGYLASIFGDVRGSEMPNLFSARTRKIYSWPGISFPTLQEVLVTEARAVTQSPRLTSHFSTM